MKSNHKNISWILAILVVPSMILCTGCKKEPFSDDQMPPVLFQYEYINHAWVYTHKGWFITPEGKMFRYSLPEEWNEVDDNMMISEDELKDNLDQAKHLDIAIDKKSLEKFWKMIPDLRLSRIIESTVHMADAGVAALYAWIPKNERKLERVLIATSGDINQWSAYPDTEKILEWLKQVGEEAGDFYWFKLN